MAQDQTEAQGWQQQFAKPGPYVTTLAPQQEQSFQQWVSQNKIPWKDTPNADYDMRGYYAAQQSGDPTAKRSSTNQHFPDKWKTPYHKSFSSESMYSTPNGPKWNGQKLVDGSGKVYFNEAASNGKKLVKVNGVGTVAFPQHMDDRFIAHAIKTFRAMDTKTTEQSEHARQLKTAQPVSSATPNLPEWATTPIASTVQNFQESHPQLYATELARQKKEEESAAKFRTDHPVAGGVVQGVNDFAEGMTSPVNAAMMVGAPESKILSGIFAVQAASGSYRDAEAAQKAYEEGNNGEAARLITQSALGAGTAGLAGAHAYSGLPEGVRTQLASEEGSVALPTKDGSRDRFRNPEVRQGAEQYAQGINRNISPYHFATTDPRAMEISDAYEAMKHDPSDPKVKASYDALKKDIRSQYDHATKGMGIKFEPWTNADSQPYANSAEMMRDIHDNNHLHFFQGGDMPADHPLAQVDPETGLSFNDMLRPVHDLFGHSMEGYQFGGRGEENAWLAHSQMFSPEAIPALTTETKGQNSWVFGPHMRDAQGKLIHPGQPGHLKPPERPYADQKAGLLPDRYHYRNDQPLSFMSPNLFNLNLDTAVGMANSPAHKLFSRLSDDLTRELGNPAHVDTALGHWEGGAENSVMHHFPIGTDPDTVIYHGALMSKAARQNYFGAFFPEGGGNDRLYTMWVDGRNADPEKIARVLENNHINGSTIKPAEDGFEVYLIGEGEQLHPKVQSVAKELGVKGVENYDGKREFIGDKDRDRAERNYDSKIKEIESTRHPEWRAIRERFESRPDYGSLRDSIRESEQVAGTPREKEIIDGILFKNKREKDWNNVQKFLSEDEKKRYDTDDKRAKIVEAANQMPILEEWDAAVKAGISGKLWYERSSRAFDALIESQPQMFRKSDKNKFLNFVAALSPVQPVRQNLLMAVNLWDKWVKAGRPVDVIWKDQKNLSGIASKNSSLYRVLKGTRNTYGVDLPARLNNAIRALQDQPMSGPKVSAFAPNLGSDVEKSTNDTWMAVFGDTDPNRISQPHFYDAMTSLVRQAGKANNIPPRQAQAAIWSFIKSLAELSGWGKDRWIPPQEIVKQGLLTPELLNQHAADFADLLTNDDEIRSRIKAIGGDLNALDKKLGKYVPKRPEQGPASITDPRLLNAAGRLEAARANAKTQSHLAAKTESKGLFDDTSFDTDDIPVGNLDELKKQAEARNPRNPVAN